MSKHPCRKLLFKHHTLKGKVTTERYLSYDWLTLHNCGITEPRYYKLQNCSVCGEEVCIDSGTDYSRGYLLRTYLDRQEYDYLIKTYDKP